MPKKDKGDIDMTEAEAHANIAAHENEHGHEMHGPPDHLAGHDSPSDAELAADAEPPDWHKQGRDAPHGWRKEPDGSFTEEG